MNEFSQNNINRILKITIPFIICYLVVSSYLTNESQRYQLITRRSFHQGKVSSEEMYRVDTKLGKTWKYYEYPQKWNEISES